MVECECNGVACAVGSEVVGVIVSAVVPNFETYSRAGGKMTDCCVVFMFVVACLSVCLSVCLSFTIEHKKQNFTRTL